LNFAACARFRFQSAEVQARYHATFRSSVTILSRRQPRLSRSSRQDNFVAGLDGRHGGRRRFSNLSVRPNAILCFKHFSSLIVFVSRCGGNHLDGAGIRCLRRQDGSFLVERVTILGRGVSLLRIGASRPSQPVGMAGPSEPPDASSCAFTAFMRQEGKAGASARRRRHGAFALRAPRRGGCRAFIPRDRGSQQTFEEQQREQWPSQ
jgi:hypothetical protein